MYFLSLRLYSRGQLLRLSASRFQSAEVPLPVRNAVQVGVDQFVQVDRTQHHPVPEGLLHRRQPPEQLFGFPVHCREARRILVDQDRVDARVFAKPSEVVRDGDELSHLSVVFGTNLF